MYSAPMPLGPPTLWPEMVIKSAPSVFAEKGDLQKALHRVGVEQRFFIDRLQPPGDLRNGIDIAKLVVYHHNGHQRRVRPHC